MKGFSIKACCETCFTPNREQGMRRRLPTVSTPVGGDIVITYRVSSTLLFDAVKTEAVINPCALKNEVEGVERQIFTGEKGCMLEVVFKAL